MSAADFEASRKRIPPRRLNIQTEPNVSTFKPQDLSGDLATRAASVRGNLHDFQDLYNVNIVDIHAYKSTLSFLTALENILNRSTLEEVDIPLLWVWREKLKALREKYSEYYQKNPRDRFAESALTNLDTLIRHIESILLTKLKIQDRRAISVCIANSLSKAMSETLPELAGLYQQEIISAEHFIFSYSVACFASNAQMKEQFEDEIALSNAFHYMNACSNVRLKEMAFKLLKEKKISEETFVKAARLLHNKSKPFEKIYSLLLKDTLSYFEKEYKKEHKEEDKELARKRVSLKNLITKLNDLPDYLTPEQQKQWSLQLCHDALWVEANCPGADWFFDIAMDNVDSHSRREASEETTEYQYLQNIRKLRHLASQPLSPVLGLYQTIRKFDAIVQEADFEPEDKEEAYEKANRLMNKVLLSEAEVEELDEMPRMEIEGEASEKASGLFDNLSAKVKKEEEITGSLGHKAGIASMIAGVGLIFGGIIGITASIASAIGTLGVDAPLAFLGVWGNLGVIGAGVAMFKGGQMLKNAAGKQYKEARETQRKWRETCAELEGRVEAVCRSEVHHLSEMSRREESASSSSEKLELKDKDQASHVGEQQQFEHHDDGAEHGVPPTPLPHVLEEGQSEHHDDSAHRDPSAPVDESILSDVDVSPAKSKVPSTPVSLVGTSSQQSSSLFKTPIVSPVTGIRRFLPSPSSSKPRSFFASLSQDEIVDPSPSKQRSSFASSSQDEIVDPSPIKHEKPSNPLSSSRKPQNFFLSGQWLYRTPFSERPGIVEVPPTPPATPDRSIHSDADTPSSIVDVSPRKDADTSSSFVDTSPPPRQRSPGNG